MRRVALLAVLAALVALKPARGQRSEAETGTVTGKVTYADTQRPARLTTVVLVPAVDGSAAPIAGVPGKLSLTPSVQTTLDGSFAITKVRPGTYYVVAEEYGYLQPLTLLTRDQLNKPDEAAAKLIARWMVQVVVVANRATRAEVLLFRGGTLAGTVRFDDGTPGISTRVGLYRRGKDGKWEIFEPQRVGEAHINDTDDQGRFRITGLPAGEYLLWTELSTRHGIVDARFASGGAFWINFLSPLRVFYGESYRQRDAKIVTIGEGEEAGGLDIELRLQEMHTVTGTVMNDEGATVNAADLELRWPDGEEEFVSTQIAAEDNAFHFDYVPEGEYVLRVRNARTVIRTEVSDCVNCLPPTHTEEKTIRRFGPAERPLIVHSDLQGVVVPVPASAEKK